MIVTQLIEVLKKANPRAKIQLGLNYCESPEVFKIQEDKEDKEDETCLIEQGCCGL